VTSRKLSENGARFIASFEGFFPEPYNDPSGHATIGYGHLIHRGAVTQADRDTWGTLTEKQAWLLLLGDMEDEGYAPAVRRFVSVPLNQNQFDSLTSATYNLGTGWLEESDLRHRLNGGDYRGVRAELAKFVKARDEETGELVELPGLVRRRQEEADLFEEPINEEEFPTMFVCGIPGKGAFLITGGVRVHILTGQEMDRLRDRGIPNLDMDCPSFEALPVAKGTVDVHLVERMNRVTP
jgi:GH24 family phage-related lysozyme (muramidase)